MCYVLLFASFSEFLSLFPVHRCLLLALHFSRVLALILLSFPTVHFPLCVLCMPYLQIYLCLLRCLTKHGTNFRVVLLNTGALLLVSQSLNISVSAVWMTRLRVDYRQVKGFFFPSITALGPVKSPVRLVREAAFPEVKTPGYETDHPL